MKAIEHPPGLRHCTGCGEDKDPDDFPRHRRSKDGRGHHCKRCHAARERARQSEDGFAAKRRQYRAANPEIAERDRERSRKYAAAHAEEAVDRTRLWREANQDRRRQLAVSLSQRRRARVAQSPANDFTAAEWREVQAEFNHACAYCLTTGVPLQQEHMQPISKGGSHTRSNIVPACGPCNMRKGARGLLQFAALGDQPGRKLPE